MQYMLLWGEEYLQRVPHERRLVAVPAVLVEPKGQHRKNKERRRRLLEIFCAQQPQEQQLRYDQRRDYTPVNTWPELRPALVLLIVHIYYLTTDCNKRSGQRNKQNHLNIPQRVSQSIVLFL